LHSPQKGSIQDHAAKDVASDPDFSQFQNDFVHIGVSSGNGFLRTLRAGPSGLTSCKSPAEAVSKTVIHGHAVSFSVRELFTTRRRNRKSCQEARWPTHLLDTVDAELA
jgi:hypothetical protein